MVEGYALDVERIAKSLKLALNASFSYGPGDDANNCVVFQNACRLSMSMGRLSII